jgi:hypothetical protein
MRRTNHLGTALLVAALLVGVLAPAAAADGPRSPLGWLDAFGQSVVGWWAALAGDDAAGRRGVFAANGVAPELDPNGNPVSPELDPDGDEATACEEPDCGNEVAPELDPDG